VLGVLFDLFLFFLNPQLPFRPVPVVRGMAVYGVTGALGSLVLLLPFTWRRPARALRLLPWSLTAALVLAAVLGWVLPSYFAFYLPPGINVRLIKAAAWLTVSALVCFYTALLHALDHRRYGPRSRVALVLLALASVFVLGERRGAFTARAEPRRRPLLLEPAQRPRLLVLGLDAATFDAILPLAEQGLLPFFGQLLEGGSHGHLASLRPYRRGSLWTTLSTGRFPFEHGIVSSHTFPVPALGRGLEIDLRPPLPPFSDWASLGATGRLVDGSRRRVPALWEILTRLGVATGVVGWPLAAPVSDDLSFTLAEGYFGDPPRAAEAWPPDVGRRARLFQVRPADLEPEALPPWEGAVPATVATALAADRWRASLTSFLLEQQRDTGAVFLFLPGLRAVTRRYFGGYSAVQFEGLQRPPYLDAALLLEAYYVQLDGALEVLWKHQPGPCLLALVSAYGAEPARGWQRLRAELSEKRSLGGYFDRSPDGVLLLYGAGVRTQGEVESAELVDVVPTLLYGLGFPIARDLDGKVLRGAFGSDFLARHPIVFVPSYQVPPTPARPQAPPLPP
jgi:Type I phosphodiesterase / nucleotide pyrophosphatase